MDIRFINPFIRAATEVLQKEINAEVTRTDTSLYRGATTSDDITILLGVTGDVRGAVLYQVSEATAKQLLSEMVGRPFAVWDELAESGLAELGNVITGRAAAGLEEAGFMCRITPPTVITGRGVVVSTLDFHRLSVVLNTQFGPLRVDVALRARAG